MSIRKKLAYLFAKVIFRKKRKKAEASLLGELKQLSSMLDEIAEPDHESLFPDFSLESTEYAPDELMPSIEERYYTLFDVIPPEKRSRAIRQFSLLSPQTQASIYKQAQYHRKETKTVTSPVTDLETLRLWFQLAQHSYPAHVAARIAYILQKLDEGLAPSERSDLLTTLCYLVSINANEVYDASKNRKSYDEIIKTLNEHLYGMERLKQCVAEHCVFAQATGNVGNSILIVGQPGTGKTTLAKVIAERVYGLPFIEIDCDGSDLLALKGLVRSYAGAKPSKLAEGYYEQGTTCAAVCFEELDKLSRKENEDPYSAFIKILGPQKQMFDEFLGINLDVNSSLFIATANTSALPDYLKNRFRTVIEMDNYSIPDKVNIARNHIIPSLLKESGIPASDVCFSDEALQLIATAKTRDFGAREMHWAVEEALRKVVVSWTRGAQKPTLVDVAWVKENLELNCRYDHTEQKIVKGFAG